MDTWIPMERWNECLTLERPGHVFEVRNALGQTMLLTCTIPFPGAPWDWSSPPAEFRVVKAAPPRPTGPIPAPVLRR